MSENREVKYSPNLKKHWDKKEDMLKELAEELAFNYYSNSFGRSITHVTATEIFANNDIATKFEQRRTSTKNDKNEKCRNIMIIGAGATADSYPAIPMGGQMIRALEEKYFAWKDGNKDIGLQGFLEKFEREKAEWKQLSGTDNLDFESYLHLLSKFVVNQNALRKDIEEFTGFRYSPCLFYEIVAHLLKHSFLDVVINFNFEEMLDHVIEEEIGKENYISILSDGHCVSLEDVTMDGRLKVPIYIKPHGTYSHKSTLRFTKKHYLDLPQDIKALLIDLIKGSRGKKKYSDQEESYVSRINLICVGFNMGSLELNEILNEHLSEESKIYHFTHTISKANHHTYIQKQLQGFMDKKKVSGTDNEAVEKAMIATNAYVAMSLEGFTHLDDSQKHFCLTSPQAEIFSHLWRMISYKFIDNCSPRSIARHEVVSYLFYNRQAVDVNTKKLDEMKENRDRIKQDYENNYEYFLDRTLVEIAIVLARNNGLIDIVEILSGRVGTYYNLYLQHAKRALPPLRYHSIYELVEEFSKQSWQMNSSEGFKYSKNVFHMKSDEFPDTEAKRLLEKYYSQKLRKNIHSHCSKKKKNSVVILARLLTSEKISNVFRQNLELNYDKYIWNGKYENNNQAMLDELFRLFDKMGTSSTNYYSITTKRTDPKNYIWENFETKKLIHTNLRLKYQFRQYFKENNLKEWHVLLCVSETAGLFDFLLHEGQLKNEYSGLSEKKIILICSYEAILQEIEPKYQDYNRLCNEYRDKVFQESSFRQNIQILLLPFWQHNHHMRVFIPFQQVSERLNDIRSLENMYMYRKGLSPRINPMLVQAGPGVDTQKLIQLFVTYMCRAYVFRDTFSGGQSINLIGNDYPKHSTWLMDDSKFEEDCLAFLRSLMSE